MSWAGPKGRGCWRLTDALPEDWFEPAPPPSPEAGAPPVPVSLRRHGGWLTEPAAACSLVVLAIVVALAIFGPLLAPRPYTALDLTHELLPPGPGHWFGTDELGRDIWARTWVGARVSLAIGAGAAALDLGIGAVYGGLAGFAGGWVDALLMRVVDVLYGIPTLLVAFLVLMAAGPGLGAIMAAIAAVNWVGMARLVRAQVWALREREFVLSARALGMPGWRILLVHLLPNVAGPMLVWLSFTIPSAIFAEAFLSYVGLGVQPPRTSWGAMISAGTETFRLHPYPLAFPAGALCLTMLALYVVGDALRDRLDRKAGALPAASPPRWWAPGPRRGRMPLGRGRPETAAGVSGVGPGAAPAPPAASP